jgi:hypothetical protein
VHGTRVYSAGVGPKGPALERFPDIKKKKKRFMACKTFGYELSEKALTNVLTLVLVVSVLQPVSCEVILYISFEHLLIISCQYVYVPFVSCRDFYI